MKKKIIVLTGLIVFMLVAFGGFTYAIFTNSKVQEGSNNISTYNCLDIQITGEEEINLDNAFPIRDEEGLLLTPYKFKVKNKCNHYMALNLGIELTNENTLSAENIKVIMNKVDEEGEIDLLSTKGTDTLNKYIIINDELFINEEKEYEIRVWVDYNANNSIEGKLFKGKVIVEGTIMTVTELTCAEGYYLPANANTCSQCPAGFQCIGGTYSRNNIDQGKEICAAGTYSTEGASTCSACTNASHVATWSNGCTIATCESGYTVDNNTCISSDITCNAGKYLAANASTCTTCPAGSYCKGGTYSPSNTDQGIASCTGRTKYSASGASSCKTVSSGYYTTGCTGSNNCTGESQCKAGNYCSNGISTACSASSGKYSLIAGATSCQTCPNNTNVSTWNTSGWCSIKTCKSGYTISNNTCVSSSGGCVVYCTSSTNCTKTKPSSGLYGTFACNSGTTGKIQHCTYASTECNGGTYGGAATSLCTVSASTGSGTLSGSCNSSLGSTRVNGLGLSSSGYSCSC